MNKYLDLNRLEFVITNSCSGNCKHCSIGKVKGNDHIETKIAINVVEELSKIFSLDSIMTFGGEPLLYADTVCKIHETAYNNNINNLSIITNGYFSRNVENIEKTVEMICKSHINKILLSVDAFHQETIPIKPIIYFTEKLIENKFKELYVHPAWLNDETDNNSYNIETRKILNLFNKMGIETSKGNNIFPAGNAIKYLSEFFKKPNKEELFLPCGSLPYTEKIDNIKSISINPNGDVISCSIPIGNIYENSVIEIIEKYNPYENKYTKMIIEGGVKKLYDYMVEQGIEINIDDCYSSCDICHKIMNIVKDDKSSKYCT